MSDETNLPAIPRPQDAAFLAAIKEILEVRDGRRGDPLDRFVSLRELIDSGIADLEVSGRRRTIANPDPGAQDLTPPAAITGFTVTSAYASIILSWDTLRYSNHSHVEIWRSNEDNLSTAVQIGESATSFYTDALGTNKVAYYWVRAVSTAEVAGAYNAVAGSRGETSPDVEYLLEQLTGQITESQLYASLSSRIDLIDDSGALTSTVTSRLNDLYAQVETGFVAQDVFNSYVTADQVFAEQVRGMAFVDDTDGRVSALEGVIITQDNDRNSTAIRFDAVEASVADNTASIANEQVARATADSALTTSINTLFASVADNAAAITSEQTARAEVDAALTSAVNTLSSTVGGHTTSIQTQATTINGLSGQYTVKIDNQGYVSGFGLASTANNATPYSEFYVRADRFAIGSPGQSQIIPFVVQTSPTTINGVAVPAGVYMDSAFIKDGTITNAKIGNAAIDDAKIASLNATKITAGTIAADRLDSGIITSKALYTDLGAMKEGIILNAHITNAAITSAKISQTIQSDNFDGNITTEPPQYGNAGWAINKNGNAVFNAGYFRGAVYATSGEFTGELKAATGTFSGTLSAATGTFTGALSAATGTFAGDLLAGVGNIDAIFGETQTFTASTTITVPDGYDSMSVTVIGAGGGGGGSVGNNFEGNYRHGLGGNKGFTNVLAMSVTAGQQFTLSIGVGGAGGHGGSHVWESSDGSPGGSSSLVGWVSAAGGTGGSRAAIEYARWDEGLGKVVYGYPTAGQSSPYGAGGAAGVVATTPLGGGTGGTAAGGGGASSGYFGTNWGASGGRGGDGYAIVQFYKANSVVLRAEYNTLLSALTRQGIQVT